MKNKKLYYILKSVWMVVILLTALIFMNRDVSDISAQKDETEETRLNIALVNEDNGLIKNDKTYNLGSDYVKKIEKDSTYNWYVVSRGVGESGLKNGTYNLLITVPSNFSEKLLELDSPAPEKIQVNYKINSNGNATLENESKIAGRKIVNDLSQQLVDLYVVSIMDSLFTAQKNIQKVYANQTESVLEFEDLLYQPTLNFKNSLPSISTYSQSALSANDLLAKSLGTQTDGTDSLINNQESYSTTLEELLQQRAEGKLTYEDFVNSIMSLETNVLSDEVSTLFQTIDATSNSIEAALGSDAMSGSYTTQVARMNEQLLKSKEEIIAQQNELTAIQDAYFNTYQKAFFKSFGLSSYEGQKVTLKEVLEKRDTGTIDSSAVGSFDEAYLKKMQERLNLLFYKPADTELNDPTIPYLESPNGNWFVNPNGTLEDISGKSENITGLIDQINAKIDTANATFDESNQITKLQYGAENISEVDWTYYNDLKAAYEALVEARGNLNLSGSFSVTVGKVESGNLIIQIPNHVAVTDMPNTATVSADGKTITIPISSSNYGSFSFKYEIDGDYDNIELNGGLLPAPVFTIQLKNLANTTNPGGNVTITGQSALITPNLSDAIKTTVTESTVEAEDETTSSTEEETVDSSNTEYVEETTQETTTPVPVDAGSTTYSFVSPMSIDSASIQWERPVDVSAFLDSAYKEAQHNYAEQLGRIKELYQNVYDELVLFDKYPFDYFHNFLSMDMTEVFKAVLNETFMAEDGEYYKQLKQLNELLEQANTIEGQSAELNERLFAIQADSLTLSSAVITQAEQLSGWRDSITEILTNEQQVSSVNELTDSGVTSSKSTLESLIEEARSLKEFSQMNVEEAGSVKSVFDSFDKEIANAQLTSEGLSDSADVIKDNLNKELANNNDFVSAFIKVLNNAHNDGVPNNTLLSFIANPVNGNAEATIKSTEIAEPFTWILIMYTLSLFVAYLFATQPIVKKVKDKFKREQLWFKDNILETGLLAGAVLILGIVLGLLSIAELGVVRESQIVWMMMMILFMLIFTLLNHYLLKQFHVSGFAISLFIFISYVFVTDAIGNSKANNSMIQFLSNFNPLSIGEMNLTDILAKQELNVVDIVIYFLLLAALVAFNLFIWKRPKKTSEGRA